MQSEERRPPQETELAKRLKERLDKHLAAADQALRERNWTKALEEVEYAISLDPTQTHAFELQTRIEAARAEEVTLASGSARRPLDSEPASDPTESPDVSGPNPSPALTEPPETPVPQRKIGRAHV